LATKSLKKRVQNKRSKKLDDYWNHIGRSLGEKLEFEDIMEVPDRTIIVGKKNTAWDDITSDLQDTANNTSQFVKIINAHLKNKKSHIEKIIELADNFDQEIQNLRSDNERITKLRDTPIHEFKSYELRKLAQELLKNREKRLDILKKLKNDIIKVEEDLHQSNKKIENVNDQILEKELKKNKIN